MLYIQIGSKVFLLYKQSKIPYFMYHLFSTVYSALFDFFSIPEEMTIQ